jgi:glycine/D-amino acid oxidase-like deaminating enzyme
LHDFPDRAAILELEEHVVFNCTGLGAKALFSDPELVPVKGQLAFLVAQPEIDYMYVAGEYYMFPRSDGVLLGGTHEADNWTTSVEPAATARIMQAHRLLAQDMRLRSTS